MEPASPHNVCEPPELNGSLFRKRRDRDFILAQRQPLNLCFGHIFRTGDLCAAPDGADLQDLKCSEFAESLEPIRLGTDQVLTNPNNPAEDVLRGEQASARSIGLRILALGASTAVEIEQAFADMVQQRADALLVNAHAFFAARRELLATLSARRWGPTLSESSKARNRPTSR